MHLKAVIVIVKSGTWRLCLNRFNDSLERCNQVSLEIRFENVMK